VLQVNCALGNVLPRTFRRGRALCTSFRLPQRPPKGWPLLTRTSSSPESSALRSPRRPSRLQRTSKSAPSTGSPDFLATFPLLDSADETCSFKPTPSHMRRRLGARPAARAQISYHLIVDSGRYWQHNARPYRDRRVHARPAPPARKLAIH